MYIYIYIYTYICRERERDMHRTRHLGHLLPPQRGRAERCEGRLVVYYSILYYSIIVCHSRFLAVVNIESKEEHTEHCENR